MSELLEGPPLKWFKPLEDHFWESGSVILAAINSITKNVISWDYYKLMIVADEDYFSLREITSDGDVIEFNEWDITDFDWVAVITGGAPIFHPTDSEEIKNE